MFANYFVVVSSKHINFKPLGMKRNIGVCELERLVVTDCNLQAKGGGINAEIEGEEAELLVTAVIMRKNRCRNVTIYGAE